MDKQEGCLYERFGGDQQVSELIDQFYYKRQISESRYEQSQIQSIDNQQMIINLLECVYQQKRFFSQMMGDKKTQYTGRDLIEVHRNLNISDQQFDKFKIHLKCIAQDMEVSVEDIQELLEHVERHRNVIVFNK